VQKRGLSGAVAAVALLGASYAVAQDLHGWLSEAATSAVALSGVEESMGAIPSITFSIRNTSGRPITAIAVSFRKGSDVVADYVDYYLAYPPYVLPPGGVWSLKIGASDTVVYWDRVLHIDGAMFASGAQEGLPERLAPIEFKRLGTAFEAARLAAIWGSLGEAPVEERAIDALLGRISGLPENIGDALGSLSEVRLAGASLDEVRRAGPEQRHAFLDGVRNAREDAQRSLLQLRGLPVSAEGPHARSRSSFLQSLRETYAARLAALADFLAKRKGGQNQ